MPIPTASPGSWTTTTPGGIPVDPPHVPDENPTGDHRCTFELPGSFDGAHRVLLRLDGVESAHRVWLNGQEVGTGTGSRLVQEYDVTAALRPGTNVLLVRVHQWSAATYLEDQDQWWLPGIFREVTPLEVDADHGRVLDAGRARADLLLMERHNVDAVRTSHYPPHPVARRAT